MPSFTRVIGNLHQIGATFEVSVAVSDVLEGVLKAQGQPLPVPIQMDAMVDILSQGVLIYVGYAGVFTLSF